MSAAAYYMGTYGALAHLGLTKVAAVPQEVLKAIQATGRLGEAGTASGKRVWSLMGDAGQGVPEALAQRMHAAEGARSADLGLMRGSLTGEAQQQARQTLVRPGIDAAGEYAATEAGKLMKNVDVKPYSDDVMQMLAERGKGSPPVPRAPAGPAPMGTSPARPRAMAPQPAPMGTAPARPRAMAPQPAPMGTAPARPRALVR